MPELTSPAPSTTSDDRDLRAVRVLRHAQQEQDPAQAARLRQQVVLDHQGLAVGLANRFAGRGIELDDLVQVAMLGLVQAARRYDPERGSGFTAFAVPTISGEIKRCFRDQGWAVRPPRGLQELHQKVREMTSWLQQELHREPTVTEIADAGGFSPEQVREARAAGDRYRSSSLDQPTQDGSGPSLGDVLAEVADDPFDKAVTLISLRAAMEEELNDRERRIVSLRFGADLTQRQIGELIGISQMQVSRILSSICGRLRVRIDA